MCEILCNQAEHVCPPTPLSIRIGSQSNRHVFVAFAARNESLFERTLPRKGKTWAILVGPRLPHLPSTPKFHFAIHYSSGEIYCGSLLRHD